MTFEFAFRHVDEICNALRRKPKVQDPKAPYDGFDESDDTEDKARTVILESVKRIQSLASSSSIG